jgi:ABC-type transport system substrate-binding protein
VADVLSRFVVRRGRRSLGAFVLGLAVVAGLAVGIPGPRGAAGAGSGEVRILGGAPTSFDPAAQSDVLSAAVTAQLFEGLTAFDPGLTLRPALARSWDIAEGGRRVTFHLRPGLTFSDGSPITAADVVRSWLRLIDPAAPSPLAALMADVTGAEDYRTGRSRTADSVGLAADGLDVTVRLARPASDFPSIVAAGPFAVVPRGVADGSALTPGRFVGSGGYVLAAVTASELTLAANGRYWAGTPAIATVHLITSIGGRSPVAAFQAGDLDYAPIGSYDASWIRFDAGLGPQLRAVPALSVEYLGFDASRPPFSDVRVRQAVAAAVDWKRIVGLANPGGEVPATGMIPDGVPGRGAGDYVPAFEPDRARSLLAEAGFPGGRGFPVVTLVSGGTAYGDAVRAAVKETLGISVGYEVVVGSDVYARLSDDPPAIWTLGWIADYPGSNDFLGVLLGSTCANNLGRWVSPEFDQAIADAGSATDPAAIQAAFARAQEVVRRDAPVVPLAYADGWALARPGLLGAGQNGLGILRCAGLAWGGA